MIYCGWIPTVVGHLSFQTIGMTSHPTNSVVVKCGSLACIVQERDLLDVVLPFSNSSKIGSFFKELFGNYIIGVSGKFTFVCFIKDEISGETISGDVYLIANKNTAKKRKNIRSLFSKSRDTEEDMSDSISRIEGICRESCCGTMSYKLEREGKIAFMLDEASNLDGNLGRVIANQFFYFFKDIAHVHQHHDPSHDAITELTKVDSKNPDNWIEETRFSLYRAVIRYKRFRNEKALFRASGVLAYTKSFEDAYVKSSSEQSFNQEALESSLAVSRAEIKHFDQKRIAKIEAVRNLAFAVFGLVLSVSALLRLNSGVTIKPDPILIQLIQFIAKNPIQTFAFILIGAYAYSYIVHKRDPAERVFIRTSLRWVQGFRRRWHFIYNILVSTLRSKPPVFQTGSL